MKRVLKCVEPLTLAAFKEAFPNGTWDEMRNEPMYGQQAFADCRRQVIGDQGGLCAYCEKKLDINAQLEHFYPKSFSSKGHNLHLDWHNMLAVCDGGKSADKTNNPLPENLSCDANKDREHKGRRLYAPDNLLNPRNLPSSRNLFVFNVSNGCLSPNKANCDCAEVDINKLEKTIEALNLNCHRLCRERLDIYRMINKRRQTLMDRRYSREEATDIMSKQYFSNRWPQYFTTYRCCLGQAAEKYLRSINYNG